MKRAAPSRAARKGVTPPPFDQQVTFLYSRDPERSFRFYGETLALPLVLDQGAVRIYRAGRAGAFVGVCRASAVQQPPPPDRAPPGVIVTFVTDDVEGWYRHLRERGVAFEKAPAVNPEYRIEHCFLRDPDGYLLEIQRFLDPAWPRPKGPPMKTPRRD